MCASLPKNDRTFCRKRADVLEKTYGRFPGDVRSALKKGALCHYVGTPGRAVSRPCGTGSIRPERHPPGAQNNNCTGQQGNGRLLFTLSSRFLPLTCLTDQASAEKNFSPTIPATISPMQRIRASVLGSSNRIMPSIAVPTAPIPVHAA